MQTKPKEFSVNYLYVAVFTTVTALLWVGFEVFRALTTPAEIEQVSKAELQPLSSEISQEALRAVRERLHIPQERLDELESTGTVIVIEEAGKEATASGRTEADERARMQTESQEASQSGAF